MRRLVAGEEAAFDEFAADYLPPLHRFASRRLRSDPETVREVVQVTVCKAIPKLSTFRGEAALMTWLCACCRNEIAGYFRQRKRRGVEVGFEVVDEGYASADLLDATRPETPETRLLQAETAELVHDAIDQLPPHYGLALEWKYLEGASVREIGRRLDLGEKAAESLLTRARKAFREKHASRSSMAGGTSPASPVARRMEFES